MKTAYTHLTLLLLHLLLLAGCKNATQPIVDTFRLVETYMADDPDTALLLLKSITPSQLHSEKDRAYYDLLDALSQYVADQTVADSAIQRAYAYYEQDKQRPLYTKAELMKGIALYQNKEWEEALQLLLDTETNEADLETAYFKEMLQFYLGMIYYQNNRYEDVIVHFRKELSIAQKDSNVDRLANTMIHYAIALKNLQLYDSTRYYLEEASLLPDEAVSTSTKSSLFNNLAALYTTNYPDLQSKADSLFDCATRLDPYDINTLRINRIEIYYKTNRREMADSLSEIVTRECNDTKLLMALYSERHEYYKRIGIIDSAYSNLLLYKQYSDSVQKSLKTSEIVGIQFAHKHQIETKNNIIIGLTIISILFLISLIITGFFLLQYKRNLKLRTEYLGLLSEHGRLQEQLEKRTEEQNSIIQELANLQAIKRGVDIEGQRLLASLQDELTQKEEAINKLNESLTISNRKISLLTQRIESLPYNLNLNDRQVNSSDNIIGRLIFQRQFVYYTNKDIEAIWRCYANTCKVGHTPKDSKQVLHSLSKIQLTNSEKLMALLYYEDVPEKHNLYFAIGLASDESFRSSKSRFKKKLKAMNSDDPVIKTILNNLG